MEKVKFQELLDAGCHFGHLKRKWNPKMAPYIFMERNAIHIIDLHKTAEMLEEAATIIKQIAKSGRKILFVATKKQIKSIVANRIKDTGMPYVVERWLGGMLTNFPTIRNSIKKMSNIDRMKTDGTLKNLSKRERLQIDWQREKLDKNLGSIADMNRLPAALFVVDVFKENIAVKEANSLNIPIFGIVDSNSDPDNIKYVIPANDDSVTSVTLIMDKITNAVKEGLKERKEHKIQMEKEKIEKAERLKKATSKKEEKKEVEKKAIRSTKRDMEKTSTSKNLPEHKKIKPKRKKIIVSAPKQKK